MRQQIKTAGGHPAVLPTDALKASDFYNFDFITVQIINHRMAGVERGKQC